MRRMLYLVILAAVLVIPVRKADISRLRPIEVIHVYKDGTNVILQTDTDDMGVGKTALAALENMKQTSPAVIYFDTARYLLIAADAGEEAVSLQSVLKATVELCEAEPGIDLKEAAKYLPTHGKMPGFKGWKNGTQLPVLRRENGRIKIMEKSENKG